MSDNVVADAGPLIALARAGLLPLLRSMVGGVLIPLEVLEELRLGEARPGAKALSQALDAGWIRLVPIDPVSLEREPQSRLDPGEREAIQLAEEDRARFLLMDERQGRMAARARDLRVIGTAGLLLAAKEKGLLEEVRHGLDRLEGIGYYLSKELRETVVKLAGEE